MNSTCIRFLLPEEARVGPVHATSIGLLDIVVILSDGGVAGRKTTTLFIPIFHTVKMIKQHVGSNTQNKLILTRPDLFIKGDIRPLVQLK